MRQTEQDLLVLSAQEGNSRAFSLLCEYYHKSLLRFAFKICHDEQVSQDAVQEAWINISTSLHRLEDPRAFKSWIYRAVRWRVNDFIRKRKSIEHTQQEDIDVCDVADTHSPSDDDSLLLSMIEKLPEIEKQAIYLFYLEGMKVSEIAIILNVAGGTIKSRLNRARKLLRKLIAEYET